MLLRVLDQAQSSDRLTHLLVAATAGLAVGADDAAFGFAARAVDQAKKAGVWAVVPFALDRRALAELRLGRLTCAADSAREGLVLAQRTSGTNCVTTHLASLALANVWQGDGEQARKQAEQTVSRAAARSLPRLAALATWALACLDLTAGAPSAAVSRLRLLSQPGSGCADQAVALAAVPHLVEAAVRCGATAEAESAWRAYDQWATTSDSAARRALSQRCQALLAT
nr:hypothetical protein [Micromonospora sp. DSM 115978]